MIDEIKGVILKGIGGFYYVSAESGIFECRARGLFRKQNITPLVGDKVVLKSVDTDNMTAMIYEILPRKNQLKRPAVANVTSLVAVIAAENPRPNLFLLDKLIASAENSDIEIIICINKTDLSDGAKFFDIYKSSGFEVINVSAATGKNIDKLRKKLKNKINVFAGNSGVGKSSIINLLLEEEVFDTGEISAKAERGKHTTRHSELRELPFGGFIIDTPGFGSLEIQNNTADTIADTVREFKELEGECRFMDCRHRHESGCAVIRAVEQGKIPVSRYESYCSMLEEINSNKNKK